jgi:hypothetical protein
MTSLATSATSDQKSRYHATEKLKEQEEEMASLLHLPYWFSPEDIHGQISGHSYRYVLI